MDIKYSVDGVTWLNAPIEQLSAPDKSGLTNRRLNVRLCSGYLDVNCWEIADGDVLKAWHADNPGNTFKCKVLYGLYEMPEGYPHYGWFVRLSNDGVTSLPDFMSSLIVEIESGPSGNAKSASTVLKARRPDGIYCDQGIFYPAGKPADGEKIAYSMLCKDENNRLFSISYTAQQIEKAKTSAGVFIPFVPNQIA